MKTLKVKKTVIDKPEKALHEALKEAIELSSSSVNTHYIIEHIVSDGRKWQAMITVLHQPSQSEGDHLSHFFIRKRDESYYRAIMNDFKFDYIHIVEEGKFWQTILKYHPDMELYDATHNQDDSDTSGETSGGFSRPTLVKKPKQAFSGKIGVGPSI